MKSLTGQTWCSVGKPASVELSGRCPMRDGLVDVIGAAVASASSQLPLSISDRGLVGVTLQGAGVPV